MSFRALARQSPLLHELWSYQTPDQEHTYSQLDFCDKWLRNKRGCLERKDGPPCRFVNWPDRVHCYTNCDVVMQSGRCAQFDNEAIDKGLQLGYAGFIVSEWSIWHFHQLLSIDTGDNERHLDNCFFLTPSQPRRSPQGDCDDGNNNETNTHKETLSWSRWKHTSTLLFEQDETVCTCSAHNRIHCLWKAKATNGRTDSCITRKRRTYVNLCECQVSEFTKYFLIHKIIPPKKTGTKYGGEKKHTTKTTDGGSRVLWCIVSQWIHKILPDPQNTFYDLSKRREQMGEREDPPPTHPPSPP